MENCCCYCSQVEEELEKDTIECLLLNIYYLLLYIVLNDDNECCEKIDGGIF